MTVLEPEEYDISYFDGKKARYSHNAGYSRYERWYRNTGPDSLGEFWKDEAQYWVNKLDLKGKKFLDIGCAKGFLVKDLRDMGVNAYGIDVSQYAVHNCEPEVAPYLTVGDARYYLSNYKDKQWDVLFTRKFMECIPEIDLPNLVSEMNRVSKLQMHIIDEFRGNEAKASKYYIDKTLKQWLDEFDWDKGTKLINTGNPDSILIK